MGMGSLDMNKNESEFIEISNFYQKVKIDSILIPVTWNEWGL